jgi:hypothetical protein
MLDDSPSVSYPNPAPRIPKDACEPVIVTDAEIRKPQSGGWDDWYELLWAKFAIKLLWGMSQLANKSCYVGCHRGLRSPSSELVVAHLQRRNDLTSLHNVRNSIPVGT